MRMASWIIHLRVAQAVFEKYPSLKNTEFVVGNIAPDSGVPTPDGKEYIPSGELTHFRYVDENGLRQFDERLYLKEYLTPEKVQTYAFDALSFHIAYAVHLTTDRLWAKNVTEKAKNKFEKLFNEDRAAFRNMIRRDWYDKDFLYLKNHPDFEAYEIFKNANGFKNTYVDFYTEDAVESRKEYILSFYEEGVRNVEEREMYISDEELDDFVKNTAEEAIRVVVANCIQSQSTV